MSATPAAPDRQSGAEIISASAGLSDEALRARLDEGFRQMAAAIGSIIVDLGEFDRRQAFRQEGATSTQAWTVERYGVSTATARALTRVGERAWDLPHLVESLCAGDVSFDKIRALANIATPEIDEQLRDLARERSVRELADVARTTALSSPGPAAGAAAAAASRTEHNGRFLRFNDQVRTMTVQLPAESYAETRSCLESRARNVPTDGETPWDQRLCDGFLELIRSSAHPGAGDPAASSNPNLVVVHVPLAALVDDSVEATEFAGDLERDGLIDCDTVQRIACDATIAVAVDDDVGHTMYEGRARREPTDAQRREVMRRDRHCRFPGCTNVTFTNVHHIVPWKPGGRTDLENLALVCLHHHHVVHSGGWTMSGNANEELHFVGPTGRVMVSRPSLLWTRVASGSSSGSPIP
ncbi:MAG: HNH endonuclease [Acidimicrobiales bacterium]